MIFLWHNFATKISINQKKPALWYIFKIMYPYNAHC